MVVILIEDQYIEIRWCNTTKRHYESLGYKFTKNRDPFIINVRDLPLCSNVKVNCICDYCGDTIQITYQNYLKQTRNETMKYACNNCKTQKSIEVRHENNKQLYFDEFSWFCNKRGYIPISTVNDCLTRKSRLKYLCPIHGVHEATFDTIKSGCGCPNCGRMITSKKNTLSKDIVKRIVEGKNNNTLLNPDEYDKVKTPNLQVRCGSCGQVFVTSLASITASNGACRQCGLITLSQEIKLDIDDVTERIESKNGNTFMNPGDYVDARVNNLIVRCGSCGRTFTTSLTNYSKNMTGRCPDCNEVSYGEYLIALFLDKYNISYTRQAVFSGCEDIRLLPFDFYLPTYNLCIEFDGEQHIKPTKWGSNMSDKDAIRAFNKTQKHDAIKNIYCKNNGISLLRIPYSDLKNIDSILMSELNL